MQIIRQYQVTNLLERGTRSPVPPPRFHAIAQGTMTENKRKNTALAVLKGGRPDAHTVL